MSIKEICLQMSLFCASLFGGAERDEEVSDDESAPAIRQIHEEHRKKIEQEFLRLAYGCTMGDIVSWGKEKNKTGDNN